MSLRCPFGEHTGGGSRPKIPRLPGPSSTSPNTEIEPARPVSFPRSVFSRPRLADSGAASNFAVQRWALEYPAVFMLRPVSRAGSSACPSSRNVTLKQFRPIAFDDFRNRPRD